MTSNLYPTIGTTPNPIYVQIQDHPEVIKTDQSYFYIQLFSAQAAFYGPFWVGAPNLAIKSQVNLHLGDSHTLGNQDLHSIIAYRTLSKSTAVQLGVSQNLVDFVPAKMKQVSMSIEYIVDSKNYLKSIANLISSGSLLTTISLSPGATAAATAIGGLANKLINAFMPESSQPILRFSGDFNLIAEGLKEGYYVILGSHSKNNPLPTSQPRLEIKEGGILYADGKPVNDLSYVIFRVGVIKSIRDLFKGTSPWRAKLEEAKRLVNEYLDAPNADKSAAKMQELWDKQCLPTLREARALLSTDANFLNSEIEAIYYSAYHECSELIKNHATRGISKFTWRPDPQVDRKFLAVPKTEDMNARLSEYAEKLNESRKVLKALGRLESKHGW